jgi:hypothetical protein
VVVEGGTATWLHRRAVEHAEEEEDDFFFPLPKGYLGPTWLLGRWASSVGCDLVSLSSFFLSHFIFLFYFLFYVSNLNFDSVLPDLEYG